MAAINMPNLDIGNISEGLKDKKNYEAILDTLQRYRKELNFYLMNLDLDNMPSVGGLIGDLQGDYSLISQTVDGILLSVGNIEGDVSAIQVQADNIVASVSNAQGDISALQIQATGILASVADAEGNIAALQITAGQIQTTVAGHTGQISAITQTASNIQSTVADHTGQISTITQNASSLVLRFDNMKSLTGTDGIISGGVTTISASGITVETSNNSSKLEVLATTGFSLYTNGVKKFYVDTSGKIQAKGLVIDGDSEFKGKIDVTTDVNVGKKINLGLSTDTTAKGIYYNTDSYITSTSKKMTIYSDSGLDIFSNTGDLNIGTKSYSGASRSNVTIGGNDIFIDASTSYRTSGSITYKTASYGTQSFINGSQLFLTVTSNGLDFQNRAPLNLPVTDYSKPTATQSAIRFRTVSNKLQFSNTSSSGTWYNLSMPESVQDQANTSYGIEFRYYSSKLQYKRTNSSTWVNII